MPKRKNNNSSKKAVLQRAVPIFVAVYLVVITGTFAFYKYKVDHFWDQATITANARIMDMILLSAKNVGKPLPVDARSGSAFVREMKLMLPPADYRIGQMHYYYMESQEPFQQEIGISSVNLVNDASRPFYAEQKNIQDAMKDVPKLQACTRGIHITMTPLPTQKIYYEKVLKDGRTLYFYQEPLCLSDNLFTYIKQIESY